MSIVSYIKVAIEAITGFNECDTFLQRFRSLRSCSNGTESQELKEDDELKLQNSLQCLQDSLSAMYNFIDRVEWRSHEDPVAELLPKLRAAVYDAEDLLEDFRCYEQKVKIEGNATSAEPGNRLFHDVIQGNFRKLTQIKERLDNQFGLLERMGLHQATPRFDRSVRPETTRFPTEAKIFGRDDEIKELIRLLGVPSNNRRGPSRPKRKRSAIRSSAGNQVCATLDNNEATITSVPVLPIYGIGGVGKTTLAQNICSHPQVQKHFHVILWICVSDDFDVQRLTKEAIEQFSGKVVMKDNLDSLQVELTGSINKRRFLVVLDDMWAENGELWKRFCAPFKDVLEGSMMLVTTRSEKVANIVRTMDPFLLEGLKDNVFQSFFKLCVFGSDSSNNSPELESIGEQILPKLKGSPLAAKTLGRLLGMSFDPAHWNMILNSQLWAHKQEVTEIMPALRLSYIYLPFHLKRCFSFCAVYPKDYNFVKEDLAEIWVASGFVEPRCNIPLQQIGCEYFEELAHLSFFQKLRGKYVMHDLIHDMAQLVSKDDCFIIKEKKDLERIPQRVRHLSVLKSEDVEWSDLENLSKQTKLRTLLCEMSLKGRKGNNVMVKWCAELFCMRVMVCASVSKSGLPDSISNMKNLRYLKISDDCLFDSLPAAFCHLYNLQLLSAKKCKIKVIPKGFSNLINLQKFESKVLNIDAGLLNNFNPTTEELCICNLYEISKDQAAKIELMKKSICSLTLVWSKGISPEHKEIEEDKEIEVFQALHPPTNIKSVRLECYPCESLRSWSHGSEDPTIFSSLEEITVKDCPRLSSLEHFLQPAYMPAIKKMVIRGCTSLESVERLGDLPSLEELGVYNCPKINSQRLVGPSLKTLFVDNSRNFGDDIDCRSLTRFELSRYHLASLTLNREKVPRLTKLVISGCRELETLRLGDLPSLEELGVYSCPKINSQRLVVPSLKTLFVDDSGNLGDDIDCRSLTRFELSRSHLVSLTLNREKVPRLTQLVIRGCTSLESVERLGHLPSLEVLTVNNCPKINSQRLVAPSLKMLFLNDSGNLGDDIDCRSLTRFELSSYHLASLTLNREKVPQLTKLVISGCTSLESVRLGHLPSLEVLTVCNCPKINSQHLVGPSLKELFLDDSGNLGDDIDCRSLTRFQLSRYHLASLTLNGEKVPLLTNLVISGCRELETLNGWDWPILRTLAILSCPRLKWENGVVLPSSLQEIYLRDCGYFSVRCLENLTYLKILEMETCKHIKERYLCCSNLNSLQKLTIKDCEDLVSIGGPTRSDCTHTKGGDS